MPRHLDENKIRRQLRRYVTGEISLRKLYRWFIPATQDVREWGSPAVQDLVYGVKLLFAEYTSGHRTEADLQTRLNAIASTTEIRMRGTPRRLPRKTKQVVVGHFQSRASNRSPGAPPGHRSGSQSLVIQVVHVGQSARSAEAARAGQSLHKQYALGSW